MDIDRLEKIEKQLFLLTEQINLLTTQIELLHKTCGRMDTHISFVENVYDSLKAPLNYITDSVNSLYEETSIEYDRYS